MNSLRISKYGACAVALSLAMPIEFAAAQIDEIVVTARKRQESFIDVPVVSTAITAENLAKYATNDFFNVADRIPGLIGGNNVGSAGANLTLRGVGTSSSNNTSDGAVSVNVDGLQFSHGDILRSGFFDVEQVEVLKGPQALFFGKNSPGGIVSLQTADPTDEYEVIGRGGYEFEAEEKLGELILSGPITDVLGARLALSYSDQEGYFDNVAQPTAGLGGTGPKYDKISNTQTLFGRMTLNFEPTERFDARLKINYEKREIEGDGGSAQIVGCDVAFDPFEDCVLDDKIAVSDLDPAAFGGVINGLPGEGVPYQDTYTAFGTLEMNFDFTEELTLTSVSGMSFNEHEFMINGTFQPGTLDQTSAFLLGPGSVPIVAPNGHYQRYVTEEVRLTSDFAEIPVNFMIGGFYEDGFQEFSNRSTVPQFGVFNNNTQTLDIKTLSAFGQVIWDVTDTIELAGGLRWTKEERTLATFDSGITVAPGPTIIPGVGAVTLPVSEIKSDNVSPEFTATWRPQDNFTLFAAYKEGFKSGSFNVDQPSALDRSYDPETAQGFEIGLKSILLSDTLRINGAVYRYKYDDLQVGRQVSLPGGAGTVLQIVNAASAKVTGVEVDFEYVPPAIEGLSVFGGLNYNKGEFDEFEDAACYGGQLISDGCNLNFDATANQVGPGVFLGGFTAQDLSGESLPRSPEWSANFGFDYEQSIGTSGLLFGISSNTTYTDDMVLDSSYNPRAFQDSFFKTNASLRLLSEDGGWELAFIGNNLNDKITASTCATGPFDQAGGLVPNPSGLATNPIVPGSKDQSLCFAQPGREAWIRLTVRPMELFTR